MELELPPLQPYVRDCRHANGWSDPYGALHTAAEYCGGVLAESYCLSGLWQHGVFGPWQEHSPGVMLYHTPAAETLRIHVARPSQADYLGRCGFGSVRAIGMPIVYAPDPPPGREPGSLLVIPTHTLVGDAFPDRSCFERYADAIAEAAGAFRSVTVCIHPNCRKNGLWLKEFSERGLPIVFGADPNDANALKRMRLLFSRFETVATNGWGSHVAYALAFGAKVAIDDLPIISDWRAHLKDPSWARSPEALAKEFSEEVIGARRDFLRPFLGTPGQARADVALGRWLIGADSRVSPGEMRAILEELLDPPPAFADLPASGISARSRRARAVIVTSARDCPANETLLSAVAQLRRARAASFEILITEDGPLADSFRQHAAVRPLAPSAFLAAIRSGANVVLLNTPSCAPSLASIPLGELPVLARLVAPIGSCDYPEARHFAAILSIARRFLVEDADAAAALLRFGVDSRRISTGSLADGSALAGVLDEAAHNSPPRPYPPGTTAAAVYSTWARDFIPAHSYVGRHLARAAVREQALAQARQGLNRDAVHTLFGAARADLQSGNPPVVIEGLIQIADDLAGLAPELALRLRTEAARFASAAAGREIAPANLRDGASEPVSSSPARASISPSMPDMQSAR